MTPPLSIGSEVVIIGPTISGRKLHVGEKFKISSICNMSYSGGGFPWYPASSLQLVPKFEIGDRVEIIGPPTISSYDAKFKFVISEISKFGLGYSAPGIPWYPASSLRLVDEELKVGDWVEVIGPSVTDATDQSGKTHRISRITNRGHYEFPEFGYHRAWPAKSVRKLTPEEALCYLTKRLTTIEKLHDRQTEDITRIEEMVCCHVNLNTDRFEKVNERLSVLEGERPEVCEGNRTASLSELTAAWERHVEWAKKVLDGMRSDKP